MKNNAYSMSLYVDYHRVNEKGELTPPGLMELLEETSVEHCRAVGKNVFALLKEGRGWFLRAGNLVMSRSLGYGEELKIESWISQWSVFKGVREFRVYSKESEKLAVSGSTLWGFMDIEKRRPAPVPALFMESWSFSSDRALDWPFIKQALPVGDSPQVSSFDLRRRDFDSNAHVHNTRYLEWVMEAIPTDYYRDYRMTGLEGSFIHEARENVPIHVETAEVKPGILIHNVLNSETGAVMSTGRSCWEKGSGI